MNEFFLFIALLFAIKLLADSGNSGNSGNNINLYNGDNRRVIGESSKS